MNKIYKIVAVGSMNDVGLVKSETVFRCSNKKDAIDYINKEFESIWSVEVTLMIFETLKLMLKIFFLKFRINIIKILIRWEKSYFLRKISTMIRKLR